MFSVSYAPLATLSVLPRPHAMRPRRTSRLGTMTSRCAVASPRAILSRVVQVLGSGRTTVEQGGLVVSAGGATITAGGLAVDAGGVTVAAAGLVVSTGGATVSVRAALHLHICNAMWRACRCCVAGWWSRDRERWRDHHVDVGIGERRDSRVERSVVHGQCPPRDGERSRRA